MQINHKPFFIFTAFIFVFCLFPFVIKAQEQQAKIGLGEVAESDFIDIRNDSWVLREAFFAQEYNADIIDYGSLLADDCAFETKDDEFEIKKKASYYSEIRKNRTRIYRIMTTITGDDITYDFNRKGYSFPQGFSVWSNEYYGDEAGKFFFERGSYIPIAEDVAKAIRAQLKSSADVKIAADVRVVAVNEFEERKQHNEFVKSWAILLGAPASAVNRTWLVKHREVILKPVRYQFFVQNNKVYDVALLSEEDKVRLRAVGGNQQDFNAWSNVQGSELTVESYIELHRLGISSLDKYQEIVPLGITIRDLSSILKMGRTIDELKILKQNNLEISDFSAILNLGGNIDDLLLLKKDSLTINEYKTIIAGKGTLSAYASCLDAGCKDISEYLRSISMQIPVERYLYLCKQHVALDDYFKLSSHNTTFEDYQRYSEIKPINIDDFLTLKADGIGLETYNIWTPYIENIGDYKHAVSFDFSDFKAYNDIRQLSFQDYVFLKEALVSRRLYQDWASTANSIQQYPLIETYKADFKEYRWFQTYSKSFEDYLSELKNGWRESKDYKEYKRDLHRQYLYPARGTSLVCFLTSGACVGAGFILRAISSSYMSNTNVDYDAFVKTATQSTWDKYSSDYNTYKYTLQASDITFYAAGGLVILSGFTFFVKKENPHYIASILDKTDLHLSYIPNGLAITFSIPSGGAQ